MIIMILSSTSQRALPRVIGFTSGHLVAPHQAPLHQPSISPRQRHRAAERLSAVGPPQGPGEQPEATDSTSGTQGRPVQLRLREQRPRHGRELELRGLHFRPEQRQQQLRAADSAEGRPEGAQQRKRGLARGLARGRGQRVESAGECQQR